MPDPVINPYLRALNWILMIFIRLLRWKKHREMGRTCNTIWGSKKCQPCILTAKPKDRGWCYNKIIVGLRIVMVWTGFSWFRIRPRGRIKHSSSLSNPIEDLTSWMTVSFWSVTVSRIVSYESIDTSKISEHSHCTELNNKTPSLWNSNGFELIFISS